VTNLPARPAGKVQILSVKPGWLLWQHSFVVQDIIILNWNCISLPLLEL